MIDDLVKALLAKQPKFWGIAITFIIVCASVVPSLMGLWEKWTDARSGKRELEKEKQRLEVVMLRCQLELLKQQLHGAGASSGDTAVADHPLELTKERVPPAPKLAIPAKPWKWISALQARNPSLARLVLATLLAVGWTVFGLFMCLGIFALCFIAFPQKDLSVSDAANSLILFVPGGVLFAYAVRLMRAQKRLLAAP